MSRDGEVARVAAQLDSLLDALKANVDALSGILTRPVPPDTDETNERLVPQ